MHELKKLGKKKVMQAHEHKNEPLLSPGMVLKNELDL